MTRRRRTVLDLPRDTYRIALLREMGHRIAAGGSVPAIDVAVQLWDFAHLLEVADA